MANNWSNEISENTPAQEKLFSLIIPTYQKFAWLKQSVEILLTRFPQAEIIIVNDGSQDETYKIRNLYPNKIKYLEHPKNKGKGASWRDGVKEASCDYLIFTDDDLPFGSEGIEAILTELITSPADIVIAKRKNFYNNAGYKKILRPGLYVLLKLLFNLPYADTQCGLKGFKRQSALDIMPRTFTNKFAIDIEILYLAKLLSYSVKEVELEQKLFAPSTFNFKNIVLMFFDLIKIKFHHYEI